MNFQSLLTTQFLSLLTMGVIFLGILYVLDKRRSARQSRLITAMRERIAATVNHSLDVLLEVRSMDQDSVARQMAMLREQEYPALRVIAFIDDSTPSGTISMLRRMQRKRSGPTMRVIKLSNPGDRLRLIRRYATNDILFWLHKDELLPDGFFSRVSLEFLDASTDAVVPRYALRPDDSLSRASQIILTVAQQTMAALLNRSERSAPLLRRGAYLEQRPVITARIDYPVITTPGSSFKVSNAFIPLAILLTTIMVGAVASIFIPFGWQVITLTYYGLVMLLLALRLISYPYRLPVKLSLVLLIPVWILVPLAMAVAIVVRRIVNRLTHHRGLQIAQP